MLDIFGQTPLSVGGFWSGPLSVQDIWSVSTSVEDANALTEVREGYDLVTTYVASRTT